MAQDHPPLPPSPRKRVNAPAPKNASDNTFGEGRGREQDDALARRAPKGSTIRPERSTDTMSLQDFDRHYGITNRKMQDIRGRESREFLRDMKRGQDPFDTVQRRKPTRRRAVSGRRR